MQLLQPTALTMSSYSTDIEMGQHRVHFLSDKWLPYFQSVVYDFSTFGFYLFMSLPLKSAWASRVFATAVRCSLPPSLPPPNRNGGWNRALRSDARSVRPSVRSSMGRRRRRRPWGMMLITAKCCSHTLAPHTCSLFREIWTNCPIIRQ